MEYRPYYLAREWTRMGHQVTIVAASFSHVRTVNPRFHGRMFQDTVDGISYHWLKTPSYDGNGVRRAMNILSFTLQLFFCMGVLVKKIQPDLVITSSTHPLDNFPGKWIARRAGGKMVYEVHDLWPLSLIELGGMPARHPFVQLIQWAENFAYCQADHVVSLLPNALPHMQAHGLIPEKFIYIPNGIAVEEWKKTNKPLPAEHQMRIDEARRNSRLLVCYAGAHGLANALDTMLDAAARLRDRPVSFLLVGQGPEKKRLERRCVMEKLVNVVFLDPVEKDAIPSLLATMDVLYIGLKSEPLFHFGVSPNKMLDYMMAGKPIINAIAAGNDPVAEAGCGITIPPEDPDAFAKAVQQLLDTSESELKAMGKRGQDYCLEHHDYHLLAADFLRSVA